MYDWFPSQPAWFEKSNRSMEHIEIIDIADNEILTERWTRFAPKNHYKIIKNLNESRLLQWPRRSCEALFCPMAKGEACEAFPLPSTDNLDDCRNMLVK